MVLVLIIIAVVVFMAVVAYFAVAKSNPKNAEVSAVAVQQTANTSEEKTNGAMKGVAKVLGVVGLNGLGGGTQANSVQEFLPLDDIRDSVICVHSVTGVPYYRMMLECGSINYALKTDEEQAEVDAIFRSAITSMQFPWGIYIQTRKLDNRDFVQRSIDDMNRTVQVFPQMADYCEHYSKFLTDGLKRDVNRLVVKKKYIVIACNNAYEQVDMDDNDRFEWAREKLINYCDIVMGYMRRMGIVCHICDTTELMEIMFETMNKKEGGMVDGIKDGSFTTGMVTGFSKKDISDDDLQKIIHEFANELDACIIDHPNANSVTRRKAIDLRKEAVEMSQSLEPEYVPTLADRLNGDE